MTGLGFVHPRLLLVLAAIAAAGILALVWGERRNRARLATFGERSLLERAGWVPGSGRRLAAQGLAVAGLCLAVGALARPQFGAKPVVLTRTGRDVLFVLDLSRSMNAEDVPPSRLAAAKQAIREVLEASPGDRVGLVIFGGSALLQVPLTLDRAAFDLFLSASSTNDVSDPGTNLPAALNAAVAAFGEDSEPRYRAAVLISDGENLQGDPARAIGVLREAGIRVFTVGVGTPDGAPIPERAADRLVGYHRDESGQVVVTRLQEETLRQVASETGGSYLRLTGGPGVRRLTAELAQLEKREVSSRLFTQLVDRFQWPLALAIVAFFASAALEAAAGGRRRGPAATAALLLLGAASVLPAGLAAQQRIDPDDGESLYRAGRFQEAYDAFQRAARDGKRTPILSYDSGNALYRLGRYDDAASSFRESTGDSSAVRQAGVYNLGNSLVKASETEQDREEELRRAISAYEEALLLSPEDRDAKWNLELALRKLEAEQKRQQQSQQGGEGEGGGGGGDRNQPQPPDSTNDSNEPQDQNRQQPGPQDESPPDEPSPSQTALTEEQARRLLEAIQSEEGEVVNERNQGRARASSGNQDW